jgi:hypothetical protein
VLNPIGQGAKRVKALEQIAIIIRQCHLREESYELRYGQRQKYQVPVPSSTQSSQQSGHETRISESAQNLYRFAMKNLYVEILRFETTCIGFFSDNKVKRLAVDMIKWDDWEALSKGFVEQNDKLEKLELQYDSLIQREEWEKVKERHQSTLKSIDAVGTQILDFRELVSKAKNDSDRLQLLKLLNQSGAMIKQSRPEPNRSGQNASRWLVTDPLFTAWQDESNSLLWVYGKGNKDSFIILVCCSQKARWSREIGCLVRFMSLSLIL